MKKRAAGVVKSLIRRAKMKKLAAGVVKPLVADDGSMAEALVYLKNVSYSGGVPSNPAVLDQKGCVYRRIRHRKH